MTQRGRGDYDLSDDEWDRIQLEILKFVFRKEFKNVDNVKIKYKWKGADLPFRNEADGVTATIGNQTTTTTIPDTLQERG